MLFQSGAGGSTITVANLQRITVIGDAGKPIFIFNPTAAVPGMVNLLLAN